ncbi:MAG: PhoH family protein [Candidatus Paceibacterota bacterium]
MSNIQKTGNGLKKRVFPDGKNVYFIDTSAIMHNPSVVEKLSSDGNVVVLSIYVLAELDAAKKFQDEKGVNARTIARLLDEYRSQGSLVSGVKTKSGGIIVVDHNGDDKAFKKRMAGLEKTNDNRIIDAALRWKNESEGKYKKIALVSKDINLRVKANAFGIDSENYESDKSIARLDELYSGFAGVSLENPDFLRLLNQTGSFSVNALSEPDLAKIGALMPNQCLEISVSEKTALAIFKKSQGVFTLVKKPVRPGLEEEKNVSVRPRNNEQAFAFKLLMDQTISLIALSGKAGTGKTLFALLAAFEQLGNPYKGIEVYRPNEEIGNKLGALPGDIGEKFGPWTKPIFDNLRLVLKNGKDDGKQHTGKGHNMTRDYLVESGQFEIMPINFIRGRSINNEFVIVDEAQNLSPHEIKTILTRAGDGTKVVLTGDCSQIDTPYLDPVSNGLSYAIERFKGQEVFGTLTLQRGERSYLSELAAKLM